MFFAFFFKYRFSNLDFRSIMIKKKVISADLNRLIFNDKDTFFGTVAQNSSHFRVMITSSLTVLYCITRHILTKGPFAVTYEKLIRVNLVEKGTLNY